MIFRPEKSAEDESVLLQRAAAWPHQPALKDLTGETLRLITRQQSIDFATALLFDRFTKSPAHGQLIQQINAIRQDFSQPAPKIDAKLVIVPGALYVERPDMGGDGRVIREVAAAGGMESQLIPLASFGSVKKNAGLILGWLRQHSQERIILVSLSKGGADLKYAMNTPDCGHLFRNVIAWINICGPLNGSRMANWILESRTRTLLIRWKCWWQRRDFQFITDLNHGPGTPLDSALQLPSSLKMLTLIGFPLRRHMTTGFSRYCHGRLSAHGPNDGTTSLADLHRIPGVIYPAWGMDHYFRPQSEARSLVAAVLRYLGSEINRMKNCSILI